jgi:hypothetical protein
VNAKTIESPKYDNGFENCIRITEKVLPKTDGNNESNKSQLPQHPYGTSEKNDKTELTAVLPEFPTILFLFLFILQPKFLP